LFSFCLVLSCFSLLIMRNGETNKIDLGSTLEEEDEKENGEGRMGRGGRGGKEVALPQCLIHQLYTE